MSNKYYDGWLRDWLDGMEDMFKAGKSNREIADWLVGEGAKSWFNSGYNEGLPPNRHQLIPQVNYVRKKWTMSIPENRGSISDDNWYAKIESRLGKIEASQLRILEALGLEPTVIQA